MFNQEMVELITRQVLERLEAAGIEPVGDGWPEREKGVPILGVIHGSQARVEKSLAWLPGLQEITGNLEIILDPVGGEKGIGKELTRELEGSIIRQNEGRNVDEIVASTAIVVVPWLGQDLAAKVALGLRDCWAADVIASAILLGKPIYAATDEGLPAEKMPNTYPLMPASYAKMLSGYRNILQSFNIKLLSTKELGPEIKRFVERNINGPDRTTGDEGPKVLTESEILRYSELNSKEIMIPPRCIVTPLARETAARLGLTISIRR